MGEAYRMSPPGMTAEGQRAEWRGRQPLSSAGTRGRTDKKAAGLTKEGVPGGRDSHEVSH